MTSMVIDAKPDIEFADCRRCITHFVIGWWEDSCSGHLLRVGSTSDKPTHPGAECARALSWPWKVTCDAHPSHLGAGAAKVEI